MLNVRFLVVLAIVVLLAASRLVAHPWNFTPVAAMALFGGAYFANRKIAFAVPLLALLVSDILLGQRYGFSAFYFWVMAFSHVCFVATVGMGLWIRGNPSVLRIGSTTLAASVLHFVVTNFGFWMLDQLLNGSRHYTADAAGLIDCYVAGVPYFRNMLAGNVLYSALLFGGFALAQRSVPALADSREESTLAPVQM